MADNNLVLAGLDFAQIKENLKNYLKNNSNFSDYNFEGSGLTAVVNLLAYNTQFQNYYLHMVANDMFLDTAVMRSSIISHAKSLGYIPRSAVGARAKIQIIVDSIYSTDTLVIEQTDRFETVIDGVTYPMFPIEDYPATRTTISGGYRYTFPEIVVRQGTPLSKKFTVTGSETQKFILENANIDTNTIQVSVFATPSSSTSTTYTNAESVIALTASSLVFFVQETRDNKVEIYFGDDIIGTKPSANNVIVVRYNVVAGDLVNDSTSVTMTDTFQIDELSIDSTTVNSGLTILENVNGGAFAESMPAIKLKAPRNYAGQQRSVTENDYKFHIEAIYPNVDSIRVWGGQDNIPPFYGKVFISIKPGGDLSLSDATKTAIQDYLSDRNLISITPVLVDPEILYLAIDTNLKFNPALTTFTGTSLEALVKARIVLFGDDELNSFDSVFRYSKFCKYIDDSDPSINSNITKIVLRKKIVPSEFTSSQIFVLNMEYMNPLLSGTVSSNTFTVVDASITNSENAGLFFDDLDGILRLVRINSLGNKIFVKNAGTIDYETGYVSISNITFGTISVGDTIYLNITPVDSDISSVRNNVITIQSEDIKTRSIVSIV